MARLTIKQSERVLIVGKTGSGKTYLAEKLTGSLTRLIVLDPKGQLKGRFNLEEWGSSTEKAIKGGEAVRVRAALPPGQSGADYWESILALAYHAGNITIYIDEIYGVVPPGSKPDVWLTAAYTRGREKNVAVWGASQRPVWVPLISLSEADWFFVFRLQLPEDRARMAGIIDETILKPIRDPHGFFYYYNAWDMPKYTRSIT